MALIPPSPVGSPFGSYTWADWYEKVRRAINNSASISWSQITDFTGSNLNSLATRNHSDLQNVLGGGHRHIEAVGNATLVAGTKTVTLASITANSIILLTVKTIGGTPGTLSYTLSAGASFTINSSNAADTSTVSYLVTES